MFAVITELKAIFQFNWILCVLIVLLTYCLVNYVKNIYSYPRGPFPWPILGNVLHFRGKFTDPSALLKLTEWTKQYGPVYTIWVGQTPVVMVNNFEIYSEASIVKKNDFIDRPDSILHKIFQSGSQNVFSTNGHYWEALRKVAVFAIRKFTVNERLSQITNVVMDEALELMTNEKQAINPIPFIDFMIYNILSLTAYGNKFGSIDDKLLKDAKRVNDDFYEVMGNGLISEFIPWLRPFYYHKEIQWRNLVKESGVVTKQIYLEHKKSFKPGIIRDFTDCVIEANDEAIRENYARNKYLSDDNLYMVVNDLFQAGTDTTQTTMRWALLFLANDPKLQQKIYEEIIENINEKTPTEKDKHCLPFTYAFLLEVLRFRPPAPVGVDHTCSVDSELGGYKIPKNTRILFYLYYQNNDPKYWTNPEQFEPKRFLDSSGHIITSRVSSFVTFGLGRRQCPGEKLALNNAFLMITRLIQKIRIELSTGAQTANLMPINILIGCFPKDYQIYCYSREVKS